MFPEGRIFDFLIVGVVALIVVGPKDLPILMRRFGQFVARIRGMAAEFRASFDELARQSELDELRREVDALRQNRPTDLLLKHTGASEIVSDIRADLNDTTAALHAANAPLVEAPGEPPPPLVSGPEPEKPEPHPAQPAHAEPEAPGS